MSESQTGIEIVQLTKHLGGVCALSDVSMSVPAGQVWGLLGENGAGKTTLLRLLMGLLVPDRGSARIGGLDACADRVQLKRIVGYVPDVAPLYEYLTGSELLRFVGTMHGLEGPTLRDRCRELLEEYALESVAGDYVLNYSLGMRKKLLLSLATIHRPSVLLLDEPTTGLDPLATRKLCLAIRRWAEGGILVLLSTHRLDLVDRLCDGVAVLRRGRLAWSGQSSDLALAVPELVGSLEPSLANRVLR